MQLLTQELSVKKKSGENWQIQNIFWSEPQNLLIDCALSVINELGDGPSELEK